MTLKLDNYFEVNNVFNYKINNKINTGFKTVVIVVPKNELLKGSVNKHDKIEKTKSPINKKNYIYEVTKSCLENINKENNIDNSLKNLLFDVYKHLKKDKAKESQIMLQILDSNGKQKYINIIYQVIEDSKKLNKQLFLNNDLYRESGAKLYRNLKHNLFRNVNLVCQNDDILLLLLEGFLLSMYEFTKYKTSKLPEFKDQLINQKLISDKKQNYLVENNKSNSNSINNNSDNNDNNNNNFNNQSGGVKKKSKNTKKSKKVKKSISTKNIKNTKKSTLTKKKNKNIKNKDVNKHNNYFLNIISQSAFNKKKNKNHKKINNNDGDLHNKIKELLITIRSIYLCRDLVNEPSNVLTPRSFINFALSFIKKHKLPIRTRVLKPDELKKKKFNLMLSVGQGSAPDKQTHLLILEYKGNSENKINRPLLMIGKGVTHDTGGFSIKGSKSMSEMKTDMAGGAIVLATMLAHAQLKNKNKLICMIPLAENSLSEKATVPGQVIKSYGGITVEVTNTDAEGRLLMADCLAYASRKFPKYQLLDIATLTGEQFRFSCQKFSSAVQINSFNFTNKLIKAGEKVGERIIPLPYINEFSKEIKSDIADVKNVSTSCKASLYPSSTFLSKFIQEDSKWIHIDIGGNEYKLKSKYDYKNQEASGLGVKLLLSVLD